VTGAGTGTFANLEQLLRERGELVARIDAASGRRTIARDLLLIVVAGGACFGAAIGSYHGGEQIAYAALKLPMLLLLTAALCVPALTAFNFALDRPASLARDSALALACLALGSLVLLAVAPLLLLAKAMDVGYHLTILMTFACCATAGGASLGMLLLSMRRSFAPRATFAALSLCLVFVLVGGQVTWILRPYLVRSRTEGIPLFRPLERGAYESAWRSIEAPGFVDTGDEAPL
jgi:hypothetical protein